MSEPARIPLWRRDGSIADYALVDQADYEELSQSRWYRRTKGYAAHYPSGGKGRQEQMSRRLLGLQPGDPRVADHIDRNKLNNQRANLRVLTNATNMQNRDSHRGSTSQYRGVSWCKRSGAWLALGRVNNRKHYIGSYADELEAAKAAAEWRRLNMPYSPEATGT